LWGSANFCAHDLVSSIKCEVKTRAEIGALEGCAGMNAYAGGGLPHFIYYIRDFGPVTSGGLTYQGLAGEIQLNNI